MWASSRATQTSEIKLVYDFLKFFLFPRPPPFINSDVHRLGDHERVSVAAFTRN